MSSIILSQIGLATGTALGGPVGGAIGQGLGATIGQEIDNNILFRKKTPAIVGAKLVELSIQTSTYGKMIPIIYGKVKIAGNIIWASEIKEEREDIYQRRSKFGGKSLISSQYKYSISLAIAIGEGEIHEIYRVWLNDQLVDPRKSCYRFYNGSETQMPDPLIEACEGHGKTPAFRGLSYIVIENLQLAEFGNQIPNFLFEVKRKVKVHQDLGEIPLEERIKAMVMIPGTGEFAYDPLVHSKLPKNYNPKYGNFNLQKTKINQNNRENKADCLVALDQLKDTCPNIKWVSPVVSWFTTSTTTGNSKILPGVEYKESSTSPDEWKVDHYTRKNAHLISKNKYASPIYGGTSNDASILRYLDVLKNYDYKIMFYPMVLVDQHNKPWRGRISGNPAGIKEFFYGEQGYNKFILHYANLVKGKVDAFLIGSEFIGLTKVRDSFNKFPAVDALIDLARLVKEILGPSVKISYAADWSEYHHTSGGWYNLDPLWASEYIDFVGIDAYFPLTNSTTSFYNEDKIINGWHSGEGYEYYYSDPKKTNKKPLKSPFAWKNIEYWWKNEHFNPDGKQTPWRKQQKKIWFTEIGFPSTDLASNQPNVFYSPDSVESSFPIHSSGQVDFVAQRQALSATEKYWRNSEFLEEIFVWCWDARPFPYWPDLYNIWKDGECWSRGHWVNGKLGLVTLQAIIQDICKRIGIKSDLIKAEELCDLVDGIVISTQDSVRDIINLLKTAYFFDTHEENGKLVFSKRINRSPIFINKDEFVVDNGQNKYNFTIQKADILSLPKMITVNYLNYLFDYQIGAEQVYNSCAIAEHSINIHLPIILDPLKAKNIAQITMNDIWGSQEIYQFTLSPEYIKILPNSLITLNMENELVNLKVINSVIEAGRVNKISAISVKQNIYQSSFKNLYKQQNVHLSKEHFDPGNTELIILNIPRLPYEVAPFGVYLGVYGSDLNWRGAEVIAPDSSILYFKNNVTTGIVIEDLEDSLKLLLLNGELYSKTDEEIAKFANLACIGEEIIQFEQAKLLNENEYLLSGLKRELFGSITSKSSQFVLLDHNLQKLPISEQQIGKKQEFLVISQGHEQTQAQNFEFIYQLK